MQKDIFLGFVFSLLLHLILLSLFFITLENIRSYRVPGAVKPIMGFIAPLEKQATQKKKVITARHGLMIGHKRVENIHHKIKRNSVLPKNKVISGKQLNKLIVLLYKAINKHKVYPAMAQQLGQTGIVYIGFVLHRDGLLSQVHVAKSSGFVDLDNAALQAVRSVEKIFNISDLLGKSQQFVIPIQFLKEA